MDEDDVKSLVALQSKKDGSYIRVIVNIDNDKLNIKKLKFLVKRDIILGDVIYAIRKKINLQEEDAMYLFVNDQLINPGKNISQVYEEHGNKEYTAVILTLKLENTFGS